MNKISEFINSICDEELKLAIVELQEFRTSGILPYGTVRTLGLSLSELVGISRGEALVIIQRELLVRASFQWAGVTYA